jgi:RND superfamily putative drug exporter
MSSAVLADPGSDRPIPLATLTGDEQDAAETAQPLVDVVEAVDGTDGFRVTTVGFGSVEGEISTLLQETLSQGELIGILVALVILLVVFGAVVATAVTHSLHPPWRTVNATEMSCAWSAYCGRSRNVA